MKLEKILRNVGTAIKEKAKENKDLAIQLAGAIAACGSIPAIIFLNIGHALHYAGPSPQSFFLEESKQEIKIRSSDIFQTEEFEYNLDYFFNWIDRNTDVDLLGNNNISIKDQSTFGIAEGGYSHVYDAIILNTKDKNDFILSHDSYHELLHDIQNNFIGLSGVLSRGIFRYIFPESGGVEVFLSEGFAEYFASKILYDRRIGAGEDLLFTSHGSYNLCNRIKINYNVSSEDLVDSFSIVYDKHPFETASEDSKVSRREGVFVPYKIGKEFFFELENTFGGTFQQALDLFKNYKSAPGESDDEKLTRALQETYGITLNQINNVFKDKLKDVGC